MAETRQRRTDPHNRYRDRVAPETEETFGLSNVPGFERPMASGPRDTLIGQDELGNPIYRTILGTQYTVKPNPDQRTTRGKVEDWVEEGAPLPSMSQVGEMVSALPGAIYESAQGALDGTGTLGDAVGFAPAMQAASLPARVPAGSLRVFGGRNASFAPTPNVNVSSVVDFESYPESVRGAVYRLPQNSYFSDFKEFFTLNGYPEEEASGLARQAYQLKEEANNLAEQKAGWFVGTDGLPRFEIDDSKAVYLGSYFPDNEPVPLKEILYHTELFTQYPDLADIEVTKKPMEGGLLGEFDPANRRITLNSSKPDDVLLDTLLHEVQHAVQKIEGFDGGSNLFSAGLYGPVHEANSPEAMKAWEDYQDQLKDLPRVREERFLDFSKRLRDSISDFKEATQVDRLSVMGRFNLDYIEEGLQEVTSGDSVNDRLGPVRILATLSDLKSEFPEISKYLERNFSPIEIDLISKLDKKSKEFSPFRENYRDQLFGVETPKEPLFLDPRNPDGYPNMFKLYKRNAGETEARNVETRRTMPIQERLAVSAQSTEDVPRSMQWVKKKTFAQGGLVEDQMKFAFMNEGGMIDDGATVEPTTGNEVPPGSLKEEVADTIDAKLSVGEYVVPADVVQYYGVAHFEKLRQKAKEGLAEMEANGRIGGDPAEDELPFSDEELMTEDGSQEGPQGFAEGGLAWNSPQMTGLTGTGTETVTYVGPDGTKLPILFLNGQPIQQIPQGYVPEGQQKQAQASFKSVRPTVTKGEGDSVMNTMQPKPVSEWGVEDFERYSNSQGVMDIVTKLPAILGPGGMIMGGLMNKAYQMQGQQALKEIDNRLSSTELDAQSRQRLQAVKENLSTRPEESGSGMLGGGLFNGLTGGNGLMEKLFGGGVQTTAQPNTVRTEPRTPTRPSSIPTSTGEGSALAPTSSPRPQARPQPTSAPQSQAPKNSTPAQKEVYSSSGRNNSQQVSGDPRNGRFAEGGFVKRRNKQ